MAVLVVNGQWRSIGADKIIPNIQHCTSTHRDAQTHARTLWARPRLRAREVAQASQLGGRPSLKVAAVVTASPLIATKPKGRQGIAESPDTVCFGITSTPVAQSGSGDGEKIVRLSWIAKKAKSDMGIAEPPTQNASESLHPRH